MMDQLVDKYSPTEFEDLVGNTEIIKEVAAMVALGDITNLALTGPPGTGKSTLANVICNKLEAAGVCDGIKKIDASSERSIDVIRDSIIPFISRNMGDGFKIVWLEEADGWGEIQQDALRDLIEKYNVRFILTCNKQVKLIKPLQSRCVVYRFKTITPEQALPRLKRICMGEQRQFEDDYLKTLFNGDMREAINSLQVSFIAGKRLKYDDVNFIPVVQALIKGDVRISMTGFDKLLDEGLDPRDICIGLLEAANYLKVEDLNFYKQLAILDRSLQTSVIPAIQFKGLVAELVR